MASRSCDLPPGRILLPHRVPPILVDGSTGAAANVVITDGISNDNWSYYRSELEVTKRHR
jgi:hypothetical protein